MAKQPRALKTAEETAKVPIDQPILVELPGEGGVETTPEPEQVAREPSAAPPSHAPSKPDDDPVKRLTNEVTSLKTVTEAQQRNLDRLARERDEAVRAAQHYYGDAEQSRVREAQTEHDYLTNALTAAQNQLAVSKQAAQQAGESGNFAAMAEANDQMADARNRITRAESDLAALERRAQPQPQPQQQQQQPQQQQQQPQDVNTVIDNNTALLPQEKAFLKQHPELVVDTNLNAELTVAHNRALRQGIHRGSDAYFRFVNEFMGFEKPQAQRQEADLSENNGGMVAAPVSREAPAQTSSPTRVSLTPDQREIARSMNLTDIEYASYVIKLEQEKSNNPEKYARRA